jgi:hypothetical protein
VVATATATAARGEYEGAFLLLLWGGEGGQRAIMRDEVGTQAEGYGRWGRGAGSVLRQGGLWLGLGEEAADRGEEDGDGGCQGPEIEGDVDGDKGEDHEQGRQKGAGGDGDAQE